jgi:hypothetical protein
MHVRYAFLGIVLLHLAAAPAAAQAPGDCAPGRAEVELDMGGVWAKVFNTGSLFFGNSSQAAYEVPRGSGRSPMFAAGLWVGGVVEGEVRVAGATYSEYEFWPGPIDPATGRPPNPADCSEYDRIWRVSREDVVEYYRTGVATPDLAEWPAHLGAPVFDGDGNPANYDLAAGDQPAISGTQMLWWVMNDAGDEHHSSLTPPVGLEARVSAFVLTEGPQAVQQATFYRYRLLNRRTTVIDSMYVGFFADPDLGDMSDDYAGSDTSRGMGFAYNADDLDGDGSGATYGPSPPAVGVQVVEGPRVLPADFGPGSERAGLAGFVVADLTPSPVPPGPRDGQGMYFNLQGLWHDGSVIREGGSGAPTTTMYAGDPVSSRFWSEICPSPGPGCSANAPGDRRFLVSTGPSRLDPGGDDEVLFAVVFGRGADHLDSVTELRRAAQIVSNAHAAGLLDARLTLGFEPPPPPTRLVVRRPAPNPFTDEAVMSVTLPAAAGVRVALVDVLGREVAVLADGPHEAGRHPIAIAGAGLAPGVYVARVWVNGLPAGALPLTRR